MKKSLAILPVFLLLFLGASGQYYYGGLSGGYTFPRTNYVIDSSGNIRFQPGKMGVSVQTGAYGSTNFHGGSAFGTYLSPAVSYNLSPRFRLNAGVSVSQNFGGFYYTPYDAGNISTSNHFTTTGIFVRGDYILNNKVMLSGAAYKYFSPAGNFSKDLNYKPPDAQGLMFNINYRPTSHFEINASFEYGNGNGYYNRDPFYHPGVFAPSTGW